jgi:eukaryotic-like serine/threonine-protein kinase
MSQSANPTIGRFEVERRLGRGTQGQVYLCWDPKLERNVAVKIIHASSDYDETDRAEVIDEARLAARLSHPNVVPIFEAGIHKNSPVLIFEYVEGVPLRQYIKDHGVFSESEALTLMMGIGAGMQCAHDQGVAHLDLSPNNIMVDVENRPRVMDFGLARLVSKTVLNDGEMISGTPRYMSPEHFSSRPLGAATDVFSLGLIFYELMAAKHALDAPTVDAMVGVICKVEVEWSALTRAKISPEVIALIRDMLHPDPVSRIADGGEFVTVMQDILAIKKSEEKGELTLEFLLRRLKRRPEFPAFSQSIIEVNRLTDEDSVAGYDKVGAVILRDFSLTNRVMKIANSAFFDRGSEGVKTISQAISRLGLNLVRMISNGLMMFDQAEGRDPKLSDALVKSFITALLARHLASQTSKRLAEEAFISGLFHQLGSHLIMFYLEHESEDIQALIDSGIDIEQAERRILSTTSASLGQAIATTWHFPDSIIDCMTKIPNGDIAAPANNQDIVFLTVNFANELCELVDLAKPGADVVADTERLVARYRSIYQHDAMDLVKLLIAALDKFSQISPALGINVSKSVICNKIRGFNIEFSNRLIPIPDRLPA